MTEQTTETAQVENAEAEGKEAPQEGQNPNREAAKYRTQLRDAEKQIEALRGRMEAFQKTIIASQAAGPGKLVDADDLLRYATLADLLDDDGTPDAKKINDAIETLVKERPHLRQKEFNTAAGAGQTGESPAPATWASVIRG